MEQGERIVIKRHSKSIAELSKPQPRRKPKFGTLKGFIKEIDPDWHRPQEDGAVGEFYLPYGDRIEERNRQVGDQRWKALSDA